MNSKDCTDRRQALQIAQETWDRENAEGRRQLMRLAATQGYSLTVVRPDGEVWKPDPRLSDG